MRFLALLLSILTSLAPFAAHADVKIVTPYEGMKTMSNAKTDIDESNVLKLCDRLVYEDNGCLMYLSSLTLKHISKKDYQQARKWASILKKYSDQEFRGIPCKYDGMAYRDKGIGIYFEHNAMVFYMDAVEGKPEAKTSGVYAYLCQSMNDDKVNVSKEPLDKENFKIFLEKHYEKSNAYDGDRFISEYTSVIHQGWKKIRDSTTATSDKAKMGKLVKNLVLYKNAYNACIDDKFAKEFCGFLKDWRDFYERAKINLSNKGKF